VDNSDELLVIHIPWLGDSMQVFRVDLENQVVRRINGIGNRAIFLGNRSLSTYADSLPTVQANCIYYIGGLKNHPQKERGIYMHCLEQGGKEELIEPNNTMQLRPFSLRQILMDCASDGKRTDLGNLSRCLRTYSLVII
jgi:hypothetical protein